MCGEGKSKAAELSEGSPIRKMYSNWSKTSGDINITWDVKSCQVLVRGKQEQCGMSKPSWNIEDETGRGTCSQSSISVSLSCSSSWKGAEGIDLEMLFTPDGSCLMFSSLFSIKAIIANKVWRSWSDEDPDARAGALPCASIEITAGGAWFWKWEFSITSWTRIEMWNLQEERWLTWWCWQLREPHSQGPQGWVLLVVPRFLVDSISVLAFPVRSNQTCYPRDLFWPCKSVREDQCWGI